MKIGLEAKRLFSNFTGLGNYNRFIADALSRYAPENQYHLYTPRRRNHPEIDPIVNRDNVYVEEPSRVWKQLRLTSLWRSWYVSHTPGIKTLDVFHGLSQELPAGLSPKIKQVVTMHDLIFLRYPEYYGRIDAAIYRAKAQSACNRADKVVAISEQTAQDVAAFLKIDPRKIEVVYQGCHPNFKRTIGADEKQRVREKYKLPSQYILNVGTIEKRKNIAVIVKALALLPPALDIPLVIVGRATAYKNEVLETARKYGVAGRVIFLHGAAFQDLPALYQQASVFVYPSVFEGFGIPLVEAIESGLPVVTSTGSCFREAAGPAALYADPADAEGFAHHLQQLLDNHAGKAQALAASREYIKQFEPEVIGRKLQALYKSL